MSVNLPEKILALRKARGMSQADLAEKLYVTRQTVSRWERGSAAPDAENLLRLAQVLMSAWTNCWETPQPPGSPQLPRDFRGCCFTLRRWSCCSF